MKGLWRVTNETAGERWTRPRTKKTTAHNEQRMLPPSTAWAEWSETERHARARTLSVCLVEKAQHRDTNTG